MIGFTVLCVFLASKMISAEDTDSKVYVWGIDLCKGSNYSFEGVTELQNVTGGQKFKGQIFMREAADDNNFYECKAFKQFGDEMKEFFLWNDKGICSSMNRYLGKLWKFVQRLGGVEKPGVCPIPAKDYMLDWFPLPYEQIKLNNVVLVDRIPEGRYYMECTLYDLEEKLIKACASFHLTKMA